MLSFEPNIIVIDDKEEEVKGIVDHYVEQGLGCKFYNADYADGDEMPDKPYSDVSLVFLDLFFNKDFDAEQCSSWIQSLIYKKSFYILIIWSRDPAKTSLVIDELLKINRLPFLILEKNKTDYPPKGTLKYDFTKLFDEINAELEKTSSLKEIGIWKKIVKSSANVVVGSLIKNTNPQSFNLKLQKIIVAHGGTSILACKDNNRKRNILFEALDQILITNTKNSFPVDEVDDINQRQLYNIPENIQVEVDRELNSWFHFKLQKEIPKNLITPGLLSENNHSLFKNHFSIQDDDKIAKRFEKQVENNKTITDIVLVLTRPCDVAQSTYGKNIKLLSGVILHNPHRTRKGNIDFNGKTPDSLKVYDYLFIDERSNDVALIFDFRYIFSVPEKVFIDKFKNIKIFNKELLSEMQVEYSSYSSRLGITQII